MGDPVQRTSRGSPNLPAILEHRCCAPRLQFSCPLSFKKWGWSGTKASQPFLRFLGLTADLVAIHGETSGLLIWISFDFWATYPTFYLSGGMGTSYHLHQQILGICVVVIGKRPNIFPWSYLREASTKNSGIMFPGIWIRPWTKSFVLFEQIICISPCRWEHVGAQESVGVICPGSGEDTHKYY